MQAAFVLFPGFTTLDIIGPYDVLRFLPDVEPIFVAEQPGPVSSDSAAELIASAGFADLPNPDLVVVPGGPGTDAQLDDGPLTAWLRSVHPGTRVTASVCTGAVILAAAGLLDGVTATTHWAALDKLAELGATPTQQRVVLHESERIATAAGISAGIDMALQLVAWLADETAARAIQLVLEYDPQPPFDAGHPDRAGADAHAWLAQLREAK